ncbi:MAG: hypothetical protein F4Y38_03180 [Gemmatimonadetes bacterium]|nr:hypothetical protein [Gemmatimonadota bacterium]MYG86079.1 hypothetical protein [Gemmatimonadota bacterium]MYJ90959.1 hypothetical protein [Gemmatimonadota bacterium]
MKLISWNIGHRKAAWRSLPDLGVDSSERQDIIDEVEEAWKLSPDTGVDVVLLQEGYAPPKEVADRIEVDPAPYFKKDSQRPDSRGTARSRCAIARVSDKVKVEYLDDIHSSHPGCLSAAVVTPLEGKYQGWPIHVVSFCPKYEAHHPKSGVKSRDLVDTSIHRIISDISLLIGRKDSFRMIAAGDTTVMYGRGRNAYWKGRNQAVFDRMSSIGLPMIGHQGSTYYYPGQTPATATRQLDYVFASHSMKDHIRTKALNDPEEWGPSDHCRILIEVS